MESSGSKSSSEDEGREVELNTTMDDVINSEDLELEFWRIEKKTSHPSCYEFIAFELVFGICLKTMFGLLMCWLNFELLSKALVYV